MSIDWVILIREIKKCSFWRELAGVKLWLRSIPVKYESDIPSGLFWVALETVYSYTMTNILILWSCQQALLLIPWNLKIHLFFSFLIWAPIYWDLAQYPPSPLSSTISSAPLDHNTSLWIPFILPVKCYPPLILIILWMFPISLYRGKGKTIFTSFCNLPSYYYNVFNSRC